jgi:hypothetical protein
VGCICRPDEKEISGNTFLEAAAYNTKRIILKLILGCGDERKMEMAQIIWCWTCVFCFVTVAYKHKEYCWMQNDEETYWENKCT